MNVGTERSRTEEEPTAGRAGRVLMAGAVLSLCAAGLLLWSERGAAIFNETVIAAIAWCF